MRTEILFWRLRIKKSDMIIPFPNVRSFEREMSACPGFNRGRPENALFFPDEVLLQVVGAERRYTSETRRCARAELLRRYVLSPKRYEKTPVAGLLSKWLGSDTLLAFYEYCLCYAGGGTDADCDSVFSALNAVVGEDDIKAIRNTFMPFLTADGIIPVVSGDDSWLLPFRFIPRFGVPRVEDAAEAELKDWSEHLARLKDITDDVHVGFVSGEKLKVDGDSLMLPLQMAWWRETGNDMPRYRPLRFIATGSLRGGVLEDVSADEKSAHVRLCVEDGFLIRPGGGGKKGEIAVKSDLAQVKALVRKWAEEKTECDANYAVRRIGEFDRLVRQTNSTDWSSVNRRLDHISARLHQCVDPDAWLDFLMLRSAARCHAGRTAEAFDLNREAREFAKSNPQFEARLLRLEIENLVILQDFEDFERLKVESEDIGRRIDKYAQSHPDDELGIDFKMRFFGTMGQVYAYSGLGNGDAELKKKAKDSFEKAKSCAESLRAMCERGSEGYCRRLGDVAQDANYLYLWSALYDDPSAETFGAAARQFADALNDNAYGENGKNSSRRNKYFRQRIAALGAYRQLLDGKGASSIPDVHETVDHAYFWVAGTTAKYLGALYAAKGDVDAARKLFQRADDSMSDGRKDEDGHVLKIIHMTVLAEAYRSLRSLGGECAEAAETMRIRALAMFNDPESGMWKKEAWRHWLETQGPDDGFPGLSFWY